MTVLIVVNGALRLHQNALLADLAGERVFYVWHHDIALFEVPGLPIASARWRFLAEGVRALGDALTGAGHRLQLTQGPWAETLAQLAAQLDATCVRVVDLPASREQAANDQLDHALRAQGRRLQRINTHSLLTASQLGSPLSLLPDVFTRCRHRWEKQPMSWPSWPDQPDLGQPGQWPDNRAATLAGVCPRPPWPANLGPATVAVGQRPFDGSESAGLARLKYFLHDTRAVLTYKETRNGFDGDCFASLLSPWLASGALSVQRVWTAIVEFESAVAANESTYWLRFELLWREFFQWQCRRHGTRWFSSAPSAWDQPADFSPIALSERQTTRWQHWLAADTGQPLIDANLQLLLQTGWMSNRGRQIVASHFIHDLGLDWRLGAMAFEAALLDYDPASNWGNWAYIAGRGHDPRGGRAFNLKKQAETWDPAGEFVARWHQRTR